MVQGKSGKQYSVALSDGKHSWASGLEASLGGSGEAPDAHRLLESALVACTIQTVGLYAARKAWPLEGVEAKVEVVEEGPDGNRIRREVRFLGPLSDEQRARLLEIANKCPIHRFLTRNAVIDTEMKL